MSRRGLDDHGASAEHIMILAVQQNRFAIGEALEKFRVRHGACCRWYGRPRGEDRVAVALLHDPGGTGEQAGVGDVIAVVVGKRHVSDVGRGVTDRGELREQRAIDREGTQLLRRDAVLEGAVGNFAGIPDQGSARVNDQEAGRDHVCVGHFARLQAVCIDIGRGDDAAVENIETQRLRGLRLLRLLGAGRRETEGHEHSGRQNGGHGTNRHGILPNKPVFQNRALAAAAASGNGNPPAFAFPARYNLSYALRTVSLIVVDAVVRPGGPLRTAPNSQSLAGSRPKLSTLPGDGYLGYLADACGQRLAASPVFRQAADWGCEASRKLWRGKRAFGKVGTVRAKLVPETRYNDGDNKGGSS